MFFFIALHEKNYKSQTYAFRKGVADTPLIVVFSAFGEMYQPGGYNYVWSLRKLKANILWIRDRFGYCKVGTYYLGQYDGQVFHNWKEVNELIDKYSYGKKVYFCGTSKGGSAALLYGLEHPDSVIVSGSPQYYIGDYLNQNDYHRKIKDAICSTSNTDEILNNLLSSSIKEHASLSGRYIVNMLISAYSQPGRPAGP